MWKAVFKSLLVILTVWSLGLMYPIEAGASSISEVQDSGLEANLGFPPTCTLNDSPRQVVSVGERLELSATGRDPNGRALRVRASGLPSGAFLIPAEGTVGLTPFTVFFSWTPEPEDAGSAHSVTLVFADLLDRRSTSCEFTIEVVTNRPPVAWCQDVVVPADGLCQARASIDAGSFDPDGDPLTLVQTPAGPYQLGETRVELTVRDPQGADASCRARVTVEDRAAPIVECNAPATITPPDAPISFTATAVDNCGVVSVQVLDAECHAINGAGKRVDRTDSCQLEVEGATLTVGDSGGVGNVLTWKAVATDVAGNTLVRNCRTEVVKPGR